MNKIFRVIWNHATQTWIAVSEISKSHGKSNSQTDERKSPTAALIAITATGALLFASPSFAASFNGNFDTFYQTNVTFAPETGTVRNSRGSYATTRTGAVSQQRLEGQYNNSIQQQRITPSLTTATIRQETWATRSERNNTTAGRNYPNVVEQRIVNFPSYNSNSFANATRDVSLPLGGNEVTTTTVSVGDSSIRGSQSRVSLNGSSSTSRQSSSVTKPISNVQLSNVADIATNLVNMTNVGGSSRTTITSRTPSYNSQTTTSRTTTTQSSQRNILTNDASLNSVNSALSALNSYVNRGVGSTTSTTSTTVINDQNISSNVRNEVNNQTNININTTNIRLDQNNVNINRNDATSNSSNVNTSSSTTDTASTGTNTLPDFGSFNTGGGHTSLPSLPPVLPMPGDLTTTGTLTTTDNNTVTAPSFDTVNNTNTATAGDVLNSGWNLQGNGTPADFVRHGDTVNFINGTGSKVTINTNTATSVTTIKFDTPLAYVNTTTSTDQSTPTNTVQLVGTGNSAVILKNVDSGLGGKTLKEAAAETPNNAVNVSDLNNAINQNTFSFALGGRALDGGEFSNEGLNNCGDKCITKDELLQFNAGKNIKIKQIPNGFEISTRDQISLGSQSVAGQEGVDGKVDVTGKDGSKVSIDGKDGSISISRPGKDGDVADVKITAQKGKATVDPADKDGIDRITYTTTKPDGSTTTREVATMDDGLIFAGDTGAESARKLGEKLTITGGQKDGSKLSDNANIGVSSDGKGNLTVKLAKELNLSGPNNANDGKIGGLAHNLPEATATPATQALPANVNANNAATVGDVLNAGFNIKGAKTADGNVENIDFVKPYDTVEFVDGSATDFIVTTNDNKTTTAKVDIKVDGKTIKVDTTKNQLTAVTSTITASQAADGKATFTPASADALVTANTVAEAANSIIKEGLDFAGNNAGKTVHRDLGTKLTIRGGKQTVTDATDKNVYVYANEKDNELVVKFSEKPEFKEVKLADAGKANITLNTTGDANKPTLTLNTANGKPVTIANVAAGTTMLDGTNRGDKATVAESTRIDKTNTFGANLAAAYNGLANLNGSPATNVFTVADAKNLGWVVSAKDNNFADDVRNANEVRFVGKNMARVTGNTGADGVREITVDVNVPNLLANIEIPVVYTTVKGEKLFKSVNGKFYVVGTDVNEKGEPTDPAVKDIPATDVIASMNNGANSVTDPMALANVKGNLPNTYSSLKDINGQAVEPTKAQAIPDELNPDSATFNKAALNNAATLGDVLNAGWNLQANDAAKDFVKPFDTINFADGTGTTVELAVSADGKTNTIKVNTATVYTDANGTIVKKANDGKYYPVNANGQPDQTKSAVENPQVNLVNVDGKATKPTQLGNVAAGANTIADKAADGKTLVNVDGKLYAQDQFENGKLKAGAVETKDGAAVTKPVETAKAGLADLEHSNPTNVMTVADAKNLGWVISANGNDYADDVRNTNEVNFVGGTGINVEGKTPDSNKNAREIKISINEGDVVASNEYVGPNGETLIKIGANFYNKADIDPSTGELKTGAQPVSQDIASKAKNNGKGLVSGNKVAEAIQKSGWNLGLADDAKATAAFADATKALSVDTLEKVNPNDNVRFTNGKGTMAKIATVKNVNVDGTVVTDTFMKLDVDLPITYTAKDADGNPLVKANNGKWYQPEQVKADGTLKDPANAVANEKTPVADSVGAKLTDNNAATPDYVVADPITKAIDDLKKRNPKATPAEIAKAKEDAITQDPTAKDKIIEGTGGVNLNNVAWAKEPNQAVNKDQLDQTVNKSGFVVKQNGASTLADNASDKADDKSEKVTPNDVVDFVNGKNTRVSATTARKDGRDVTTIRVDVDVDAVASNADMPVVYTNKDGDKVAKAGDGKYYKVDPATGLPKVGADGQPDPAAVVNNGDIIASVVNPEGNSTTAPTVLSNVAQGTGTLDGAKDAKGNPLVKVGDKYYKQDQFDPATGKVKANEIANNVTPAKAADPKSAFNGLASLDNAKPSNVITVADAKNLGWVISADKEAGKDTAYEDDVRNAHEVKFTGGDGIKVTGKTTDNIREINISLQAGEIVPTDVKDQAGNPLVKVGDNYYKTDDIATNGKPKDGAKPVDPNTVVKNNNAGAGFVTGNQVGDAIQASGFVVGKATDIPAADKFENKDERVNPNDELRYAEGKNLNVKLATVEKVDASGKVVTSTTVKMDVDSPIDFKYTDAKGNEYAKAVDGNFYAKDAVNADGTLKDPASKANALKPEDVAKLNKGAQLTNGIGKDGIANNPYTVADPLQVAVQKAIADKLKENPAATTEELVKVADQARAAAINADFDAKDKIVAGKGGVNLNNVAWATQPDQAVNKDQLDQTVNKSGFFVKQNGKSTLAANANSTEDAKTEKVTPNDVVNFINGGNVLAKAETKRDAATGQDITEISYNVTGLPITYTAKDGSPVAKVGDKFFKVNNAGYPVGKEVPASELATNLVNPAAAPNEIGAPSVLGNVASGTNTITDKFGDNGKTLVQVGEGANAKFYAQDQFANGVLKPNAQEAKASKPATKPMDKARSGLADLANSNPNNALNVSDAKKLGFIVGAKDNNYADDVRNADAVEFVSGNDLATVTGSTRADGVREVRVTVSKDPTFNTVQVGGNAGPKLSATPEGDLNLAKPDGSPVRIRNVAKGVDPTDAVNVGQLRDAVSNAVDGAVVQKFGDLNGKIGKVDKNMRAGVAGSNAAAGLPQVYIPGKSMLAASAGTFKGQSAIAVGYSRASDNGKVILKLQGNGNTRGDFGGSVGVGYQW
ncbi:TPA: YadA-like family protein [Pasteurella multocida]|nr:YadA-like family protein [Pasteurella multocida]